MDWTIARVLKTNPTNRLPWKEMKKLKNTGGMMHLPICNLLVVSQFTANSGANVLI